MARRKRPLGSVQIQILEAISRGVGHGFDLMDETGLPSGTVYPALSRLERDGLVTSRWENARIAQKEKRPPRRYYELTTEGRERLAEALLLYKDLSRSLAKLVKETR
ncbi:MAG TPA: PadR family transcriptional regulator [Vicinamibacteria bacterium]|jgi:DNA-binding PadR family transcriptional regulator